MFAFERGVYQPDRPVYKPGAWLSRPQRLTHAWALGQSGVGKSRMIESWIMQDIRAGRSVCVIDPHGDLYDNLLWRIAEASWEDPQLAERLILCSPIDPTWIVGFNPLDATPGIPIERQAHQLCD